MHQGLNYKSKKPDILHAYKSYMESFGTNRIKSLNKEPVHCLFLQSIRIVERFVKLWMVWVDAIALHARLSA